jgi:DNA-binding HxlR family transcriptional regulator
MRSAMAKSYHQYCPVAHALDLVGERWSLLVVRELVHGPLRYSDLIERLGCPTNVLAARLRQLENGGVVEKRKLPPPAASTIYELTEYGRGLRPVLHALAHWGARSLGPPSGEAELCTGWLANALEVGLPPQRDAACVEFRVGDESYWLKDGEVWTEAPADVDAVVEADPPGIYHLLISADVDAVQVEGDRSAVERLVARDTVVAAS